MTSSLLSPRRPRSRRIGSASARPIARRRRRRPRGWLDAQIGPADAPRGDGLLDTRAGARARRRRAREARSSRRNPPPGMTAEQMLAGHYRDVDRRRRALAPAHRRGDDAPVRRAAAVVLDQSLHRLARSRAARAAWSARSSATRSGRTSPARFETLLVASTTHPAMLRYLDNAQSAGPHSRVVAREARRAARTDERPRVTGLNENLAREVLELHTLGAESARAPASTRRPT